MTYTISLSPIATVHSSFQQNTPASEIRQQRAKIVVKPELAAGLLGLEAELDILVLFYIHKTRPDEVALQLHPRHNPANPLCGVFATRSQFRPNSIGASVAHIISVEENVITVTGLDALDQTPVLDIKPYAPIFDTDSQRQRLEVYEVGSLQEAREAIDQLDREIIRLLGNRADFVHQVVNFKENNEASVRAQTRYEAVMQSRRAMAEAVGLNPDVIEEMYTLLVENFIKEEMELLQQRAAAKNG